MERPEAHSTGIKALKAVSRVIRSAGHKPQEIVNDYGEDLLVETRRRNRLDANRLWLQVKGTSKIKRHRKRDGLRLQIKFDHAMRWIRSVDLVVVVLWDVVERVGWYAIPSDQVDAFEVANSGTSSVTLKFSQNEEFTEEAVDLLAWKAYLEHQRLLVLSARDAERDKERAEGVKSPERTLTELDFTDLLNITERRLEPDGLRYQLRLEVWEEFKNLWNDLPEGMEETQRYEEIYAAARKTTANRWKMIEPRLDLPSALIDAGAEFICDRLELELGIRGKMEEAEAREARERQQAGWPEVDR